MPQWLRQEILGNPLINYVWVLLLVLGAFVVYGIVIRLLSSRWLKQLSASQTGVFETVVNLTRAPLKWVLATVVVWLSTGLFAVPPEAEAFIQSLLLGMVAVTVSYGVFKLIDALFAYLQAKSADTETRLDDQLYPILRKTSKVFVGLITVLLVVQNWGYDITALLAGLGVGGLALALAAQDTVSNVFGAITIFVDRPFQIGDAISMEGYSGTVEAIGLRSTRLRTFDGTCVTLANSLMTKAKIENLSDRTARRTLFSLGLTYDTTLDKVKQAVEIIKEVLGNHTGTDTCRVWFDSFGDFALNISVQHWSTLFADYDAFVASLEEMNLEIKRRFEAEGIEMAFPTQSLIVEKSEEVSGS